MNDPDVVEFWRDVEKQWADSVAAADSGRANGRFTTRRLRVSLRRSRGPVVITGMSGAGKSVICKMLQGLVGRNYKKTEQSEDVEKRRVKISKSGKTLRAKLYVLPGDRDSQRRQEWVERLFKHGSYPAGVVHVVDWGMAEIWDSGGRQELLNTLSDQNRPSDLAGVRDYLRTIRELEDFRRTSRLLKNAWADRGDEVWLVIAVTKCDLYWPQISDVCRYYIPGRKPASDTPFARELRALIDEVQLAKLAILPISCVSDPFGFSGEIRAVSGNFDKSWRASLIDRMLMTIGDFNGF